MYGKNLLNEKIARIISAILAKSNTNMDLRKRLVDFFMSEGLEEKEILEILDEISKSYKKIVEEDVRFRILSPSEIENLTDDALNYLLVLKEENRINEEVFEDILLEISKTYGIIDLPILKELIKIKEIDKKCIIN